MSEKAQKIIRDIPPKLKRALAQAAADQATNMNDVAVGIIADAYGVSFTPSGKGTPGYVDPTTLPLMMPRVLRKKVNVDAARKETTATDLILDLLLAYFDLSVAA